MQQVQQPLAINADQSIWCKIRHFSWSKQAKTKISGKYPIKLNETAGFGVRS